MWKSCKAKADGRNGFLLMEVLVALAVAALLLTVFSRAFGTAWHGSRRPLDDLVGLTMAREFAQQAGFGRMSNSEGDGSRFRYRAVRAALIVEERPSRLPPIPAGLNKLDKPGRADDTGTILQGLTVTIHTPSGRSLSYETIATEKPR